VQATSYAGSSFFDPSNSLPQTMGSLIFSIAACCLDSKQIVFSQPVERPVQKQRLGLVIPASLQKQLPFKSKPKLERAKKATKHDKLMKKAVIRESKDRQVCESLSVSWDSCPAQFSFNSFQLSPPPVTSLRALFHASGFWNE